MCVHRCDWAEVNDLLVADHDQHWGVPLYDDQQLFRQLLLENAQAGLSWTLILSKQAGYQRAFDDFCPAKIARYDDAKIESLLTNPNIVRNQLKIRAAVTNAQAYLKIQQQYGSFADYCWSFVGGAPIINGWRHAHQVPTCSAESKAMSASFKRHGFKFVGATTCYAFMQAVGMVNDHLQSCFRYQQLC